MSASNIKWNSALLQRKEPQTSQQKLNNGSNTKRSVLQKRQKYATQQKSNGNKLHESKLISNLKKSIASSQDQRKSNSNLKLNLKRPKRQIYETYSARKTQNNRNADLSLARHMLYEATKILRQIHSIFQEITQFFTELSCNFTSSIDKFVKNSSFNKKKSVSIADMCQLQIQSPYLAFSNKQKNKFQELRTRLTHNQHISSTLNFPISQKVGSQVKHVTTPHIDISRINNRLLFSSRGDERQSSISLEKFKGALTNIKSYLSPKESNKQSF